ncbi:MinD/ParA family protein [Desulfovibrio sp. OttesenSCG-928-A18]|nr:MinD/ParA family protein [Desulfovibrio sp. OttesenSCG-928-A18]
MKADLPLVMSVTSGKGGVGKTNISVNLACCLAREGKSVVLLDADLGLANVDVVLGLTPKKNLFHLFHDDATLADVLTSTPYGFKILPASSGVSEMLALTAGQKITLLEAMDELEDTVDYLIVDTGAGINENVMYFNLASQVRLVILTPEPTSLTDAYALIKVMQQNHDVNDFKVLVNLAPDEKAALDIFRRLYKACDHFLAGISLDYVGFIPRDASVRKAVIAQKPFCVQEPAGAACKALTAMAKNMQKWDVPNALDGNIKFFWKRLLFGQ